MKTFIINNCLIKKALLKNINNNSLVYIDKSFNKNIIFPLDNILILYKNEDISKIIPIDVLIDKNIKLYTKESIKFDITLYKTELEKKNKYTNIFKNIYKINELKEQGYDSIYTTTEQIIKFYNEFELIKTLLELPAQYNVLIDNGSFLKIKSVEEYVDIFLEKGREYVIYFNNDNDPIIKTKYSKKIYNNNIEILKEKNYLFFFDINHCRGTDVKIPNCKGLVTLNHFNDLIDTLQSIYRLRNLNKGQTIDYYYTNIEEIITKDNLLNYLEDKFNDKYNINFLIQNINSLSERITRKSFIYPPDKEKMTIKEMISEDLELKKIYNDICKLNDNYLCNKLKMNLNNVHYLILSTSANININANTSANTSANISIINSDNNIRYNELLIYRLFNIDDGIDYNSFKHNNKKYTFYEDYIIKLIK
jgi:hypothetical protein